MKPTPKDILNKAATLCELKRRYGRFSCKTGSADSSVNERVTCATDRLLRGRDIGEVFGAEVGRHYWLDENNKDHAISLARQLLEVEREHTDFVVMYHGGETSLLADVYGALAKGLTLEGEEVLTPLPRLEAYRFHVQNHALFSHPEILFDHADSMRDRFLSVTPTLISCLSASGGENPFPYYLAGTSMLSDDMQSATFSLFKTLLQSMWKIENLDISALLCAFQKIGEDFPQKGYMYQFFFHDRFVANSLAYTCTTHGNPVASNGVIGSLELYLEDLESECNGLYQEVSYGSTVAIDAIQLRLNADPRILRDPEKVTIKCYRKHPFDEKAYYQRISQEIVLPILEAVCRQHVNGGFQFSPIARTLGNGFVPLARLVDYLLTEPEESESSWSEGKPFQAALLSGHTEVFQHLVRLYRREGLQLTSAVADSLIRVCISEGLEHEFEFILNYISTDLYMELLAELKKGGISFNAIPIKGYAETLLSRSVNLVDLHRFITRFFTVRRLYVNERIMEFFRRNQLYHVEGIPLLFYMVKLVDPEEWQYFCDEFIEVGKFEESRLEKDLITYSLQHGGFSPDEVPFTAWKEYYSNLKESFKENRLRLKEWWKCFVVENFK